MAESENQGLDDMFSRMVLLCATDVLLREIDMPESTKQSIAVTYGLAMRDDLQGTDWGKVNQAIRERWGQRSVGYIQRRARIQVWGWREELKRTWREIVGWLGEIVYYCRATLADLFAYKGE